MEERCTVYFSRSTKLLDENKLSALLEEWRHYNTGSGISGILLYVRGSIVQVLEGKTEAVETLFNKIKLDPRHTDVTRVIDRLITERLFTKWTMEYETVTSEQMTDIHVVINSDRGQGEVEPVKQPAILRMLKVFYESNHYN